MNEMLSVRGPGRRSAALALILALTAAAPALPRNTDPAHLAFARAFTSRTLPKRPTLFARNVVQITDVAVTAAPRGAGGQLQGNRFETFGREESILELDGLALQVKSPKLGECRPLRADTVLCGYTVGAPDTLLTIETTAAKGVVTRVAATMVVGKLDPAALAPR